MDDFIISLAEYLPLMEVEEDPMAIRVKQLKDASRQIKIERTGLEHSYCKTCKANLPIERFSLLRRGGPRRKKGYTDIKKQKNNCTTDWGPRTECIDCVERRKKASGQYAKNVETRNRNYREGKSSRDKLHEAAKRARALLADSYIRKLLKAAGYTDETITPVLIKEKRKKVKAVRESIANKTYEVRKKENYYSKKDRQNLTDSYVRSVIRNSRSYKGEKITAQMIIAKRVDIELWRQGVKPESKISKRARRADKQREDSLKRRNLDDQYIIERIKRTKSYSGEEITKEMMEAKRDDIRQYRYNIEHKIKAAPSYIRLTDNYIISLLKKKGKRRKSITPELIKQTRREIRDKRNAREAEKLKSKNNQRGSQIIM